MGLFEKYAKDKTSVRPETLIQNRRMVSDWMDALAEYPVKATETSIFKNLSMVETITANRKLAKPKPVISSPTIRRYMGSLGGFCRFLVRRRHLIANPVTDMLLEKTGPITARNVFSPSALATIFSSPLFTTCKSTEWADTNKPGNFAIRDHRFWILIVMHYSGARPGEIAQLHVTDVRQEGDTWLMEIDDDGGNKRTKNTGSCRIVPIHSELIRLGFLRHCERMKAAGEKQVFPEVQIPKVGQIAAKFSREINRYLTDIGVKLDRSLVVYSFRHGFVDRARDAGFLNETIAIVVGHETGSVKAT